MAYTREEFNEYIRDDLTAPQTGASNYIAPAIGVGLPASAFALGFLRTKSGGRVWDVYLKGLQKMEGALPMGIGATFRLSETISPLAAPDKWSLLPTEHADLLGKKSFKDYLSKMTGVRASTLQGFGAFEKGIEFEKTGSTLGTLRVAGGGPILASNMGLVSTGPRRTGHIFRWFNQVSEVNSPNFLKSVKETDSYLRPEWLPIGARGQKGKLAAKFLYGGASSLVGRMNLLLSSPYDLPVMEEWAKRVPLLGKLKLGVKEGTAGQMLARYTGKAAIGLGLYHGAQYLDYLGREYGPAASAPAGAAAGFSLGAGIGLGKGKAGRYGAIGAIAGGILGGVLGGPFSGAAELYAHARVSQAHVADVTGLGEGARQTEDFFPGMTKPTTLIGAAGVGLLLGGTSDYYEKLKVARSIGKKRRTAGTSGKRAKDVYEEAEGWISEKREALHAKYGKVAEKEIGLKKVFSQIKQRLQGDVRKGDFSPRGRAGRGAVAGAAVYSILNTVGSVLSGDISGAAITGAASIGAGLAYAKSGPWAAAGILALPFLLREKEDPERLKRIYSGKEKVAVKSGRFWEIGRCNTAESLITVSEDGSQKRACDIEEDDTLLGADGKTHQILGIYKRLHTNLILEISTALDSDVKTGLTTNHMVPVITKDLLAIQEVKAGDLRVGDFVQLPQSQSIDEIDPLELEENFLFYKNRLFVSITEIRLHFYDGEVYDFEIDHEDHLIQNGTFLVHNSPYEGGRPHFREHRVASMRRGDVQKTALYGSEKEYWATDPIMSPISWLMDPYAREKAMWEQGYKFPVSKTPFEDFPVLGPVLATTIGRAIKPPKKMGQEEWLPPSMSTEPPEGWAETPPEEPIMRTGIRGTIGEQMYRFTELVGMPGFAAQSIKERITGEESWFPKDQWATPSLVSGMEPGWWSNELGGLAMLCIPAGDTVQTDRGVIPIEDVTPTDSVLSRDQQFHKVLATSSRTDEEIVTLQVASFGMELRATPNHIIPVWEEDSYHNKKISIIDKPIGEVSIGDWLEVPLPSDSISDLTVDLTEVSDGLVHTSLRRLDTSITINNEIAYLLGWYAAGGNLTSHGIQLTLDISEIKYARKLQKIASREFEAASSVQLYLDQHSCLLHIDSPLLHHVASILVGDANYKSVDPRIVFSEISIRAAFLRGYMLGDRYCCTSSKDLANQTLLIGLSLGLRGSNILDKEEEVPHHLLEWSPATIPYLEAFISGQVDSLPEHGVNEESFIHEGKLYVQVNNVALQKESQVRVYDLEIEDLHYFTANYFSVHNSEGIRRYIPHKRSDVEYRNPLPSGLPSWLPGPDSGYYLDFSRASVYSEIKEPWARLPGKGYGVLNPEVKGIAPEDYPSFHRFKILADLAPWSQEYGQYEKKMSQMKAEGRLSADQILQIQATKRQVSEAKKQKEFSNLRYGEATVRQRVRITGSAGPGKFLTDTFGSAPIILDGIDVSGASLANLSMQQDASLTAQEGLRRGRAKQAQISDYLREQLYPGAEVDVFVHKDPSSLMDRDQTGAPVVPAVVVAGGTNINKQLIDQGLAQKDVGLGNLDPTVATGEVQRAFGAFWENLLHGAETPLESLTPVAPIAKFVHQRTPLEEYLRSEVFGRDVALWQKPVEHFLKPGLQTMMHWAGSDKLPSDIREKHMVNEYFDRLKHMKWKNLENQANAMGDAQTAATYASRAKNTVTGADVFSERSAYLALAKNERAYFEQFVYSPTAEQRREISKYVSPEMRRVLHAQWSKRAAEQAEMREDAGIPMEGDQQRMQKFRAMSSPEAHLQRQADITAQQQTIPIPHPSWVGWDPQTDMEDYKVKTVNDRNMDPSLFGIWDSDIQRVERRPWVEPIGSAVLPTHREMINPSLLRRDFNIQMGRAGHRGPSTVLTADGRRELTFQDAGLRNVDRYINDPSIIQF